MSTIKDAWIGTESSNRLTRNFTAEAVAKYLNIKGKISISAQMVFKFDNANLASQERLTVQLMVLHLLVLQQWNYLLWIASSQNVVAFMDYIVGNDILINRAKQI